MIIKQPLLLSILSAAAFPVWAQGTGNNDTITVTANRFQQPINSVLAPTSIVTREDIDRWQSQSVTDVMRRLPGVDVAENGGLGQNSSLFIRGTNSSHVLILVDGIRLNQSGISGSSDLSQFPIALVQRIEYIRGPRSAVYGSDAIGGIVNIITRSENTGTTLKATAGSHSYQNLGMTSQQNIGDKTRVALSGNYTYTKGFDVVAEGNYGGKRQPDRDGYINKTLYGSVEHIFSESVSGFFRGFGFDNRTDYDGFYDSVYAPGILLDTRQLYSQTWDTGLNFNHGIVHSQFIASYGHSKDYNYDPRLGRYSIQTTLDDVKQYNLQSHNSIDVGNGSIGAGVEWQKQRSAPGTSYITEGYDQRNTGLYLTAAQRVEDFSFEGAIRNDDNSQFGNRSTWQGSSGWEFIDGYRFIASYGTGFKAPNYGQIYNTSSGNRNLKPEQSKQWEGGFEGLTAGVTWRVSGYRNLITNLIESSSSAPWKYSNISKAEIKGVEATGSFETGIVSHEISYDYVDARNGVTKEVLLRRAKQQVKYQLDFMIENIDWGVTYRYLGTRYDTVFGTYPEPNRKVKLAGVSLWDISAAYPITSHLSIHGRIANLFDKNYETVYGYRTAGREYYLSGSYTF